MPKLSVIIPAYKASGTLKACLDHLYDSSFKDIEVIVVLDGPDTAASETLKVYKKVSIFEVPHGGVQKARNFGAKQATGDILLFWDADCYVAPDSLRLWVEALDANPAAAFAYSGYVFNGTDSQRSGIAAHPWDPWLLRVSNFISTMSPVRKEWFFGFDESLKSLQDWDLWLTIADKGGKGIFVPGWAFETDYPSEGSISGEGCQPGVFQDRVATVKRKHKLPERDVCIASLGHRDEGIALAKLLDADYKDMPSFQKHDYKVVMLLGMYPQESDAHMDVFRNGPRELRKVVHYTGKDVELMMGCPFRPIRNLAKGLQKWAINVCEDELTRRALADLGITAKVLPLPVTTKDVLTDLPKDFRVLVHADDAFGPLADSIVKAMPDIKFTIADAATPVKMADHSVLLRLARIPVLGEQDKKMLVNGRHAISNIKAPYAGFISADRGMHDFKHKVVEKLDFYSQLQEHNRAAQAHYLQELNSEKYSKLLLDLVAEAKGNVVGEKVA